MLISRMYLSAMRIHSKFLFPSDSAPGIIAREVLRKESCQVLASLLCIMPQLCIVSYFDFRRIAIYCLANGRAVSLAYGLRAVLSFISTGTRARVSREENIFFDVSHSYLTSSQRVVFSSDVKQGPPSFSSPGI